MEGMDVQIPIARRFKKGDVVMWFSKPRKGPHVWLRGIIQTVFFDSASKQVYKVKNAYNHRSVCEVLNDTDTFIRLPNEEDDDNHQAEISVRKGAVDLEDTGSALNPKVQALLTAAKAIPGAQLSPDELQACYAAHYEKYGDEYKPHIKMYRDTLEYEASLLYIEGRDENETNDPTYHIDSDDTGSDTDSVDGDATIMSSKEKEEADTSLKIQDRVAASDKDYEAFACRCGGGDGCKSAFTGDAEDDLKIATFRRANAKLSENARRVVVHTTVVLLQESIGTMDEETLEKNIKLRARVKKSRDEKKGAAAAVGTGLPGADIDDAVQQRSNRKSPMSYSVLGTRVCKSFFLMIYHCGDRMLKNIFQKISSDQLVPAEFSNRGGYSQVVFSDAAMSISAPQPDMGKNKGTTERNFIMGAFLQDFTKLNGLPNPGKTKCDVVSWFLPSTFTKNAVWQHYMDFVRSETSPEFAHSPLSSSRFLEIWASDYSFIKISGKKSDFCETCNLLRNARPCQNDLLQAHLATAQTLASFVKVALLAEALNSWDLDRGCFGIFMDAFDYKEVIILPIFTRQPCEYYFMSGVQVNVLGFVDVLRLKQTNYLLTESFWLQEKGVNGTASLQYHRWTVENVFAKSATQLIAWTDSCSHEFKCKYTVSFYLYFVLVADLCGSSVTSVRHVLLLPGHTKFHPDVGFALMACALKRESCLAPCDLFRLTNEQCGSGQHAYDGSSATVVYYDWKAFLFQFFDYEKKMIPNIKKRYDFLYEKSSPGLVQFRANNTLDYESLQILRPGITAAMVRNPSAAGLKPLKEFILRPPNRLPSRIAAMKQVTDKYKNVPPELYFQNCDVLSRT